MPSNNLKANGPRKVALEDLNLPPAWYSIKVWTSDPEALVSVRARFQEDRRADLRIRMEPAGKKCFQKIFKIAEPLSSVSVSLAGEAGGRKLCRIELRPLGAFSITWFLVKKGARYARSNSGHFNWKISWSHFLAALHPRGNFAFRSRYDRPGAATYEKWRAVHEDPDSAISAANALKDITRGRRLSVALLIPQDFNRAAVIEEISSSIIGATIDLSVLYIKEFRESSQSAEFVIPLDYKGIFPRGAIEQLLLELHRKDAPDAVFADNDFISEDGIRQDPRLKPLWDSDLLWCADYIRAPIAIRWASDLRAALDLPGADQKPGYALALALIAQRPRASLGRIPAILFHQTDRDQPDMDVDYKILRGHLSGARNGVELAMLKDGVFKTDWPIPATPPKTSIIIPSKDNPDILKICLDSIIEKTNNSHYEIIIADNGSIEQRTLKYLSSLSTIHNIKITKLPGPFNFSKINNDARRVASGEVLVFLNDDTKIISGDWLNELVSVALRPDVGAVGALLLYPDGSVQHAGVLLGVGGPADHAFRYMDGNSPGYLGLLRCRREVTAVTGACLAVAAKHFDAIHGFDEQLMVTCNDVDLCLRLRALGLVNIWTPWARLEHWESMSRGVDFTDAALERQADELRIMSQRWGELLDRDPTYNPGLSDFEPNYFLSV
jgi:GT2 family glycosyltransferase